MEKVPEIRNSGIPERLFSVNRKFPGRCSGNPKPEPGQGGGFKPEPDQGGGCGLYK